MKSYATQNIESKGSDVILWSGNFTIQPGTYLMFGTMHVTQSSGSGFVKVYLGNDLITESIVSDKAVGGSPLVDIIGFCIIPNKVTTEFKVTLNSGSSSNTLSGVGFMTDTLSMIRLY